MAPPSGAAALVLWLLGEAAFGLFVGLIVSFVSEGLLLAIQAISLQAGYSFATTFDPNSQADSGVLQTFLTIGTNLLFFLTGLHHTAIRAFASSLEKWPGGSIPAQGLGAAVADFGSEAFRSGLRLALPVAGFLLFADLFLALAGRLQAQLQLLSIAFPVKMLVALVSLMALMPVMVFLYQVMSAKAARLLEAALR
jgi:flagellar biosynthetic protein FliR